MCARVFFFLLNIRHDTNNGQLFTFLIQFFFRIIRPFFAHNWPFETERQTRRAKVGKVNSQSIHYTRKSIEDANRSMYFDIVITIVIQQGRSYVHDVLDCDLTDLRIDLFLSDWIFRDLWCFCKIRDVCVARKCGEIWVKLIRKSKNHFGIGKSTFTTLKQSYFDNYKFHIYYHLINVKFIYNFNKLCIVL